MNQISPVNVPGFFLIELLTACATSLLCITMLMQWQGVLIERKKTALQKLKLIAYTESKLDQLTVDNLLKLKTQDIQDGIHAQWCTKSLPLNGMDTMLGKAAVPGHFSYIQLKTCYKANPQLKTLHSYKGVT